MFENKLERAPLRVLKPYPRNARTHSRRQIEQIADSIKRFGFINPVLVADDMTILAGHGRVEAAKLCGLDTVPVLKLSHLSESEKKAYVIGDNRLAEKAGWDKALLALELQELLDLDFDVTVIGYEPAELDIILDDAAEASTDSPSSNEDDVPATSACAVTKPGDLWVLGRHRLLCGDAGDASGYDRLMDGEQAAVMFTDPPYNVPIAGFVSGHGKTSHGDFAMACGEMSETEFVAFLKTTLGAAVDHCATNAMAFVCMDWRHMRELMAAGADLFAELKNLCVWSKTNGGMGSLYRSQHELVFVYACGTGPYCNNVELGRHGRNRTNVWTYAGVNVFKGERDAELAMHPTVKPVAMVQDAIKDVSRRGAIVLDPFGGSGTTLIAAERCGRKARLIELDPTYCDVIVRRYQTYTGKMAKRASTGEAFDDAAAAVALAVA